VNEIKQYVECKDWDAYGRNHHGATFAHAHAWGESLAETYGLPIFRLAITDKSSRSLTGMFFDWNGAVIADNNGWVIRDRIYVFDLRCLLNENGGNMKNAVTAPR